jgi:hypothetical protein
MQQSECQTFTAEISSTGVGISPISLPPMELPTTEPTDMDRTMPSALIDSA